jgi:protein phosphatase 1 regulatory subunit 10
MEKFSKKLVSKCIYIQILKCTETELLGQFMANGGWNLVHNWLRDGFDTSNWPFVQEILELLLLCPVDGNRLKSNHTPKIVKTLSLSCSQNHVRILSLRLVDQWLRIAHQEKQLLQKNSLNGTVNSTVNNNMINVDEKLLENDSSVLNNENENIKTEKNNVNGFDTKLNDEQIKKSSENIKYKISNKDSGLVLSIKRSTSPNLEEQKIKSSEVKEKSSEQRSKSSPSSSSSEKDKEKSKKSSSSSSSSSSHRSSSSSKSSHRDKDRSLHKSSSSSSKSSSSDKHRDSSRSSKHSSRSGSRDKDKHRDKKESKKDVEKEQAEKDKETLSFLQPLPSAKLQRIPKRSNSDSKSSEEPSTKVSKASETVEKKKPSISIEVRKGDKPKTVKTLNSQFRNHGLAEEPPPPPSRKALKKPAATPTTPIAPLVSTPISIAKSSISPPPAKKIQLEKAFEPDVPERQGGVKLIKPKRKYLDYKLCFSFFIS